MEIAPARAEGYEVIDEGSMGRTQAPEWGQ